MSTGAGMDSDVDALWRAAPAPALRLRREGGRVSVQPNAAALDWAQAHGLPAATLQAVELPAQVGPGERIEVSLAGRTCPATAVTLNDGLLLWLLPADVGGGIALERALALSGISVWRVDMARRRIHLNAVGFQRIGLEPDPAGVPLSQVRATIHPEDRDAIARGAEQALAGDTIVDVRARYRNPDGSWREMLTRRVAERDAAGRALGLLGISMDVGEREAQREQAEVLMQRSRLAAETLGVGFWQREADRPHLVWDEQMFRIHARDPALGPPLGAEWVDVCVHPEDRPWVRERVRRADADWEPTTDLLYRAAQADPLGGERWIQSWARRLVRDGRRVALGMHMDVTLRQRDEAARQRERERLQFAMEAATVGVWERDRDGHVIYWNPTMYRLRGLDPADPRPPADAAACSTHPEDRAGLDAMVRRHLDRGDPYHHAYRVRRPDGSERWLLTLGQSVRDGAGQVVRLVGVNLDITDQRQTEVLRREKQLLERASREKSALMARLSHELRTPLNAVRGFTRLIEDDTQEPAGPRQRERLGRIAHASERLVALIDDVLEVAKLQAQADARPLPATPWSVEELLREVAAATAGEAERCGVRLRWPAFADLRSLTVTVDRLRAVQAVGHVLQQLLRRSPRGARLRVRAGLPASGAADDVVLHLRVEAPVARSGAVTPAQPTLFGDLDPMTGADAGPGDTSPGGFTPLEGAEVPAADELALDLARSLLRPMGGEVEWTPNGHLADDHGVLVHCTLRLPGATGLTVTAEGGVAPAPEVSEPAQPAAASRPFDVLCVEDNPVNLQLVCEVLALLPEVRLRTATDGRSGVESALAQPPDLLLLDLQLPDMHGIEVLRRLREAPRMGRCMIVALSADAMPEHVSAAMDAGFDAYWTKPIHFDRFLADVRRLAQARSAG
jgi:PAS domain S-box-containing protein